MTVPLFRFSKLALMTSIWECEEAVFKHLGIPSQRRFYDVNSVDIGFTVRIDAGVGITTRTEAVFRVSTSKDSYVNYYEYRYRIDSHYDRNE